MPRSPARIGWQDADLVDSVIPGTEARRPRSRTVLRLVKSDADYGGDL
jgi:hypothetical protein